MIGIEKGKVEIHDYHNEFKEIAHNTIIDLNRLIGDKVISIEHVGSTSIGIKAKPIIDLAVGISSFDIIDDIKDILINNGYPYSKTKLNGTVVDFVLDEDKKRTHNIHFVIYGEERWKEFTLFRDYLIKHPEVAEEYETLKIELSTIHNDIHEYTNAKSEFISNILKLAEGDNMKHEMRLHSVPFEMIKSGIKTIEYRLNDEKRQKLKVGDTISFTSRETAELIMVEVTELRYYDNLLDMYTDTFDMYLSNYYNSPNEVVEDTTYYTEEELRNHGCVGIIFKKN